MTYRASVPQEAFDVIEKLELTGAQPELLKKIKALVAYARGAGLDSAKEFQLAKLLERIK
ncbi:hypothetical protein D9M71_695200 [compost metagenome]